MSNDATNLAERREVLQQEILDGEDELRQAVSGLAEAAEQKLNLAGYVRTSPMTWLAGAFCLGVWLGMNRDRGRGMQNHYAGERRERR
jgi:hypothetical protein